MSATLYWGMPFPLAVNDADNAPEEQLLRSEIASFLDEPPRNSLKNRGNSARLYPTIVQSEFFSQQRAHLN
jgi:hypothetical protein